MNEDDDTLFKPKGKGDMRVDYPELSGYKEFDELNSTEVRLCWLIGNRTSPFRDYEKAKRVKAALNQCYAGASRNRPIFVEMMKGEIPFRILEGIKKMSTFNPTYRTKAKLLDEFMFDQIQSLVMKPEETVKLMDIDDEKKYTSMMLDVSARMPDLIARMESGYGVSKAKVGKKTEVMASISDVSDRVS